MRSKSIVLFQAFATSLVCLWGCNDAKAPQKTTKSITTENAPQPQLATTDSLTKKKRPRPRSASSNTQVQPPKPATTQLPNFAAIKDIKKRKQRFFSYFKPIIQNENVSILEQRRKVSKLYQDFQNNKSISRTNKTWLKKMGTDYRIAASDTVNQDLFQKLLLRVDIVPVELALAQAATESAWGKSRFAQQGNNIFGQWCFTKGCGMVPKQRPKGETYEVAIFSTPTASVKSYIKNLNAHPAYRPFRLLRAEKRANNVRPDGHTLAEGLLKYSGIGFEYVKRLRDIMRQNKALIQMADASPPQP